MIQALDDTNLADFLALADSTSVTACKLHTLYHCYRDDSDMAQFWLIRRGERPVAAMALSAGTLTLHGTLFLASELAEFLPMLDWSTIECDSTGIFPLANLLGAKVANCSIQRYCRAPSDSMQPREIPPIQDELRISEIYELLCEADSNFEDVSVFDSWLCSISHRVRHGFSKVYGIYDGERLVASAGVYTESGSCGVIESVATSPDYRRRGYASALTLKATELLLRREKEAFIVTSNLHTHELYHKLGFRDSGTLFLLKKPNPANA